MDRSFFLVIGAPRSGTTLLTSLLGAHGAIGALSESFGMEEHKIVGKQVVGNKLCVPNQIELDASRASQWLEKLAGVPGLRVFARPSRSLRRYVEARQTRVFAIIRDGNAVVRSIMKRGKQTEKEAIRRWARAVEIIGILNEDYPDRLQVIEFEQLVTNPNRVLRNACRFLDLPYDPRMMDGGGYNPIYPGKSTINASKASAPAPAYGLEHFVPEAVQTYHGLQRASSTNEAESAAGTEVVATDGDLGGC